MTTKKAKLRIILMADDVIVAEAENPILWQQVLGAIHQEASGTSNTLPAAAFNEKIVEPAIGSPNSFVGRFAKALGITEDELNGAMAPSVEAPYLHLDLHCWEEMKKQTPPRGLGSISSTGLAGTLLSLWFREANLGSPTQAQALAVLDTIRLKDKNPSRGIKTTKWLQGRPGGVIVLNPAQISKAIAIGKSFCLKKWSSNEKGSAK